MTKEQVTKGLEISKRIHHMDELVNALSKTSDFHFNFTYTDYSENGFAKSRYVFDGTTLLPEERADIKRLILDYAEARLEKLEKEFEEL